jgi:hypothetical protein
MLEKHDNLLPFAFVLRGGQEITMCGFMPEESDAHSIISFARSSLRAMNDESIRAVAIVYEGRIRDADGTVKHPDTVNVEVDHSVGGSYVISTPFTRRRNWLRRGTVAYSTDVVVTNCDYIVFPEPLGRMP